MTTYTLDELAREKRDGNVTVNGVAFMWWLQGPCGAEFALLREPHHTGDDIETAKYFLLRNRDVVALWVYHPEPAVKIKGEKRKKLRTREQHEADREHRRQHKRAW